MHKPSLFLVGVAKAGTTSIHASLDCHPDIFMSRPKEPHFFAHAEATQDAKHFFNPIRDRHKYLELFADRSEDVLGESSTSYWWSNGAARRLARFQPAAKIIVSLRDPVERAFSHYLNDVRDTLESRPFQRTIPKKRPSRNCLRWGDPALRIELGFYADRLERYLELFGSNVYISIFEEHMASPEGSLADLYNFLEVAPSGSSAASRTHSNPHRVPRSTFAKSLLRSPYVRQAARRVFPTSLRSAAYETLMQPATKPVIGPDVRETLAEMYANDTARVEQLLGCKLPWASSGSQR